MKDKKPVVGILVLVFGVILLLVVFAISRGGEEAKRNIDSVTVQKDGNTLTVSRSGAVSFTKDGELFEDFWSSDKVDTFFGYIDGKYAGDGQIVTGGGNYIVVTTSSGSSTYSLPDDELIDAVQDETSGGGSGGAGGGSSGGGSSGGGTETPTPTPRPGGGGPDPECLYWRLSYCVRKRTPSPTPASTTVEVEIREPDCDANTQTGRTVIGNELCLSTPSPTPQ